MSLCLSSGFEATRLLLGVSESVFKRKGEKMKPLITRKQLEGLLKVLDDVETCGNDREGYTLVRYADVTVEVIKWAEQR